MSAAFVEKRSGLRRAAAAAVDRAPWLVDGYRLASNPGWARAIRRDLAATTASLDFVRELPRPGADAPVALVALYRDDIFDAKVGLVLASALRNRGLQLVVLVPTTRCRRAPRYAEAFAVNRVVVTSAVELTPSEVDASAAACAALLAGGMDHAAISGWRFHGYDIGRHVLSTVVRATFDGAPDFAAEDTRARVTTVLEEVVGNVVRAEHVLDDLEPRVVLVEEANYAVNGPLVDVATARGIDVIQTMSTWRDDALLSTRVTAVNRRTDPKAVAPEAFAAATREPWTAELDAELEADFDRRYRAWLADDELCRRLAVDRDRPTAVVFAHVLWDASHFFGVDLFDDYAEWLVQTVASAVENDRVNWVIKTHPSNVFRAAHGDVPSAGAELELIAQRFPTLPGHVQVLAPDSAIDARSLYRFAEFGVTVRGTPGIEMPCFGKRVLTAGTGSYAGLGFTDDSQSRDEFLARLATIESAGPLPAGATALARRYAHTVFVQQPWHPRSFTLEFDYLARGWHPLDRNVVMRARSLADWRGAGDLDHWAAWVTAGGSTNYVAPRVQEEGSLFGS